MNVTKQNIERISIKDREFLMAIKLIALPEYMSDAIRISVEDVLKNKKYTLLPESISSCSLRPFEHSWFESEWESSYFGFFDLNYFAFDDYRNGFENDLEVLRLVLEDQDYGVDDDDLYHLFSIEDYPEAHLAVKSITCGQAGIEFYIEGVFNSHQQFFDYMLFENHVFLKMPQMEYKLQRVYELVKKLTND